MDISFDIKDPKATPEVFKSIREQLNGDKDGAKDADILVASAAVLSRGKTALNFDIGIYRDAFETNVNGNPNLVRAFLASEMPSIPLTNLRQEAKNTTPPQHPGREKIIIAISTTPWLYSIHGQASYSASKLAFT